MGTKYLVGECALVLWCCQSSESIGLNLITLEVDSLDVETSHGVKLTVKGVCQVKVKTTKMGENGQILPDHSNIKLAAQHFLGQPQHEVMGALRATMEGMYFFIVFAFHFGVYIILYCISLFFILTPIHRSLSNTSAPKLKPPSNR